MGPTIAYTIGGVIGAVGTVMFFKKMKQIDGITPSKTSLLGMAFLGFILGLSTVHVM